MNEDNKDVLKDIAVLAAIVVPLCALFVGVVYVLSIWLGVLE